MPTVLADFAAYLAVERDDWDTPTRGRVILEESQLVLVAGEGDRLTVPVRSIFDVSVETLPRVFDSMPGRPVTVAYREGSTRAAVAVAADEETVSKFTTVLFKMLLNGTPVTVRHPAKVGGRVVDSAFRGGLLSVTTSAVEFETEEGPVTVPLRSVIDFDRETRDVNGEDRPVLVASHMDNGEALGTVAAMDSARKLSILGRYLRRHYQQVLASLEDIQLSDPETETLATIYSTGDMAVSLTSVLNEDASTVRRLLHALHEKGLVASEDGNPVLTAKGRIVVTQYLERVNA